MAINWRQREPILRVLAAVYAELGEDAFKGRYDKIARLYGDNASYSAIKSFFAKEIVKLAEDMKATIANHRHGLAEAHTIQRPSILRRPIHITFDDLDDEIVIVGERRTHSELPSGRPAKSPEPVDDIDSRAGTAVLASFTGKDNRYSQARESMEMDLLDPSLRPPIMPQTSSGKRKQTQSCEMNSRASIHRRKRPHSAIEESDHSPRSFGYVTSEGRHRCALCMTELPSADMLRKHESFSELHLKNMKDPNTVFRGHTALAEHNSVSDHTTHQQRRPNPAFARGATHVSGRGISRLRQQSHEAINRSELSFDTGEIAESSRVHVNPGQAEVVIIPNDGSADNDPHVEGEALEPSTKGKSKDIVQIVLEDERTTLEVQSALQIEDPTVPRQNEPSIAVLQHASGGKRLRDVPPTWIAQTLLSSGMELLAKKCIEEHPELQASFYKCMQNMQTLCKAAVPEKAHSVRENAVEQE